MKSLLKIFLVSVLWLVILSSSTYSAVVVDETGEIKLQDLLVQQNLEICSYMENDQLADAICDALCNVMKYDHGYCRGPVDCLCLNANEQ